MIGVIADGLAIAVIAAAAVVIIVTAVCFAAVLAHSRRIERRRVGR